MKRGPLSAMDACWPGDLPALVPALEALGYRRFWMTEHHSPRQSGSPMIAAAIAAGLSETIRVGTAGVLLSMRSPLSVAEDARLLELYFPGRFDLGVAGAIPPGALGTALLDGRTPAQLPPYRDKVAQLIDLVADEATVGTQRVLPGPHVERDEDEAPPCVWLCGTSHDSARLAGELGASFAFHHYLARPGIDGPAIVATYRESLRRHCPHRVRSAEVVVAAYGLCAPTDAEAESMWRVAFGDLGAAGPTARPSFLGSAATCAGMLDQLRAAYGVDELVVQSLGAPHALRLRSYALLASG